MGREDRRDPADVGIGGVVWLAGICLLRSSSGPEIAGKSSQINIAIPLVDRNPE
jgi:hypothetical protein